MGLFTKKNDHSVPHDSNEPPAGTRPDAHSARVGGAGDHSNAYNESGATVDPYARGNLHQNDRMHQTSGDPNVVGRGAGKGQAGMAHAGRQQSPGGGSALAEPSLAPTSHTSQQTGSHGYGEGTKGATGKADTAIGGVLGSSALKHRALEKEQEANAFKTQSAEIAEAERFEREAMQRRERAVAHGAHPDNRLPSRLMDERRGGM